MFLNKHRAHEITVFWVNTGKVYPETLKMVELAKSFYPNFVEINTNRDLQNEIEGLPSDLVPINRTRFAANFNGFKGEKIQSYLGCCYENIIQPLNQAIVGHGITHLIRGERNDEKLKSTAKDGDTFNGITYLHPIETWTTKQVFDYLSEHMEIPEHLRINHSSLDCYDCTAYVNESKDRIEYTEKYHPVFFAKYEYRMSRLKDALNKEWCYD